MILEDGAGTGNKQKVKNNRAHTTAFSIPRFSDISETEEDAFLICTNGFIPISTLDTETGILYVKNTSTTKHLHIQNVRACGNGVQKWKLYKNPTTGTLISGATNAPRINLKFSNDNAPDATAYVGADGSTVTNGSLMDNFINNAGHSVEIFDGALILERNDTIALTVECSATTDICARILVFFEPNE